jgi:hypothetical protein
MKRPAFQFYPADWRKDVELQSCGYVARGIWWEMLCVMHECRPYGHLSRNGKPMPEASVAELIKVPLRIYRRALAELEDNGVAGRLPDGTIYSRRMVRDERLRQVRAEAGKLGAEFGILGREYGAKGGRPPTSTGDTKPPLETGVEPPPSSSASALSSSSSKTEVRLETKRAPGANGSDAHPGAEEPQQQRQIKSGWQSPPWVAATAATLGVERRAGEEQADFADRVHAAVDAKRRSDKAEAERRQAE